MASRRPWVVGVTGASGTPYAMAVLRGLIAAGEAVDLIVSKAARLTIRDETGLGFRDAHWQEDLSALLGGSVGDVRHWTSTDFTAGPASGSYRTKGMIVVPATAASVAGIALGISKDLIQRAAEVQLKERRRLIMVLRETPLTRNMIQRMLELTEEGAIIMPATPAFYSGPMTVQDIVDFVAGKALDLMDVDHDLLHRWEGRLGGARAARELSALASGEDVWAPVVASGREE